jgi:hypothetical protein
MIESYEYEAGLKKSSRSAGLGRSPYKQGLFTVDASVSAAARAVLGLRTKKPRTCAVIIVAAEARDAFCFRTEKPRARAAIIVTARTRAALSFRTAKPRMCAAIVVTAKPATRSFLRARAHTRAVTAIATVRFRAAEVVTEAAP